MKSNYNLKICLSIGFPMKHSRSPIMHNDAFQSLGIDNRYVFTSAEVMPDRLKMAIEGVKSLGIRGVSVTMPYKQAVMKYLDKIEREAKIIGAVNTIVNDNGKLTGYNTDWIGAITALENKTKLKNKRIAVIGCGGAARAIVYGSVKKGAIVEIFNRSKDKANGLAKEFGCECSDLNSLKKVKNMDIIINATSVGMNEDKSVINKKYLNKNQIIFDVVYLPMQTRLIKDAQKVGAQVILGYEMLLSQGVAQFELYTNMKAPVEVMRKALESALSI